MFREANFLHAHFVAQEFNHFLSVSRVSFPFDTGIDVFGVFAEDDHIGQLWVFNRAWGALVVTHWAQTNVQIQLLTQRNVQRTNAAAYWRGQWTFDCNAVVTNEIQRFGWQPNILAINLSGFFPGVNFHPGNFTLAFVGFLNSGINHFKHCRSHVNADTVAFNKWDNRIVWHIQLAVFQGDFLTFRRNNYFAFHSPLLRALLVCSSSFTPQVLAATTPTPLSLEMHCLTVFLQHKELEHFC
ncbi:Uncharacterised protein [Kluyvera cryocrescens]|nr:Uncharacterised protein [Kluyvera cryocrescens]